MHNHSVINAKEDKRPKQSAWAPGEYLCVCHKCAARFWGDKRALSCADCAYESKTP